MHLCNPALPHFPPDFSNILNSSNLDRLAQADENEVGRTHHATSYHSHPFPIPQVIRNVQEYFADYYAVDHHVFSINVGPCLASHTAWDKPILARTAQVWRVAGWAPMGNICLMCHRLSSPSRAWPR